MSPALVPVTRSNNAASHLSPQLTFVPKTVVYVLSSPCRAGPCYRCPWTWYVFPPCLDLNPPGTREGPACLCVLSLGLHPVMSGSSPRARGHTPGPASLEHPDQLAGDSGAGTGRPGVIVPSLGLVSRCPVPSWFRSLPSAILSTAFCEKTSYFLASVILHSE